MGEKIEKEICETNVPTFDLGDVATLFFFFLGNVQQRWNESIRRFAERLSSPSLSRVASLVEGGIFHDFDDFFLNTNLFKNQIKFQL